jgi:hypothetical protein
VGRPDAEGLYALAVFEGGEQGFRGGIETFRAAR